MNIETIGFASLADGEWLEGFRAIHEAESSISDFKVAMECLRMMDEAGLGDRGGYPVDFKIMENKGVVFVADLDPSKDYNRTLCKVYSIAKMSRLGKSLRRSISGIFSGKAEDIEDACDDAIESVYDGIAACEL